jgi:AraC-like DNA-binding protein
MNKQGLKKLEDKQYEKFLAKDVKGLEIIFKDGSKAELKSTFEDKIVVMKVYPNSITSDSFKFSVIQNYSTGVNASELAKRCGYDCYRTFQRHFKIHFGDTVYQWILKRKMEDVHSLVINTDMQMSEIATKLSFNSPAHLTNTYKKYFGVCPLKHRDKERRIPTRFINQPQ